MNNDIICPECKEINSMTQKHEGRTHWGNTYECDECRKFSFFLYDLEEGESFNDKIREAYKQAYDEWILIQ